jgi:hypothetical protein
VYEDDHIPSPHTSGGVVDDVVEFGAVTECIEGMSEAWQRFC